MNRNKTIDCSLTQSNNDLKSIFQLQSFKKVRYLKKPTYILQPMSLKPSQKYHTYLKKVKKLSKISNNKVENCLNQTCPPQNLSKFQESKLRERTSVKDKNQRKDERLTPKERVKISKEKRIGQNANKLHMTSSAKPLIFKQNSVKKLQKRDPARKILESKREKQNCNQKQKKFILKKYNSKPFLTEMNSISYSYTLTPSEKYYITSVKESVISYSEGNQEINAPFTHFIQSITAFQTYNSIKIPQKPHIQIELPFPQADKITLVFDMDETLIHCEQVVHEFEGSDWGQQIKLHAGSNEYTINLKIRPFAIEVLKRLKKNFELILFTASLETYASKVLEKIDPNKQIFPYRFYRQHCIELPNKNGHIKDLRIFKNRDLQKIILIDNSPHTYIFQLNNGVPITSFYIDPQDTQFLKLEHFLNDLSNKKSIKEYLRSYFKFQKYIEYENMLDLVNELY